MCNGLFTLPVRFFFPIPIFSLISERNGYSTRWDRKENQNWNRSQSSVPVSAYYYRSHKILKKIGIGNKKSDGQYEQALSLDVSVFKLKMSCSTQRGWIQIEQNKRLPWYLREMYFNTWECFSVCKFNMLFLFSFSFFPSFFILYYFIYLSVKSPFSVVYVKLYTLYNSCLASTMGVCNL